MPLLKQEVFDSDTMSDCCDIMSWLQTGAARAAPLNTITPTTLLKSSHKTDEGARNTNETGPPPLSPVG